LRKSFFFQASVFVKTYPLIFLKIDILLMYMDGTNFTNKAQRMMMQAQNVARDMGHQSS